MKQKQKILYLCSRYSLRWLARGWLSTTRIYLLINIAIDLSSKVDLVATTEFLWNEYDGGVYSQTLWRQSQQKKVRVNNEQKHI